jgi:molybdate transport system ATP-binding protein
MADALVVDVSKRYRDGPTIEASATLDFARFPVTVLFGPSGSGKTTLLRCIAGLERPERGKIRYGDSTWFDEAEKLHVPPQARRIGYLAQEHALFPHLDVRRNVAYGLSRLDRETARQKVDRALELLRITALGARLPAQLSGGERQRAALARALVTDPCLLLLDEPLSALDAPTRETLRGALRSLFRSLALPTLLVTHDRVEALALGDQVMVIADGRVQQVGPVADVFGRPQNLAVARTVGVETVVAGRIVGTRDGLASVAVGGTEILGMDPGGEHSEVMVCIRAEEVVLELSDGSKTSARNHLQGKVESLIREGPLVRVSVDCGIPLVALVTRVACEELGLVEGKPVTASIKAQAVQLVPRDGA